MAVVLWEEAPEDKKYWYSSAACRGYDSELWFPEDARYRAGKPRDEEAKRICNTVCKVRLDCLAAALKEEEDGPSHRFGIRGGLTAEERRTLIVNLRQYYRTKRRSMT